MSAAPGAEVAGHPGLRVRDDPATARYVAEMDGQEVGFAAYAAGSNPVVFTHTEVEHPTRERGIGTALVRAALDDVRARELLIVPRCPFVAAFLRRHSEYQDLVADDPGTDQRGT